MAFTDSLVVPLTVLPQVAEDVGEPVISPYLVGAGVLALLLLLLIGLIAFGGGRDHS